MSYMKKTKNFPKRTKKMICDTVSQNDKRTFET